MSLGLRALLLIAAIVLFVVAIFVSAVRELDWIAAGLACTTGAVLVRDLGWAEWTLGAMGGRRRAT